MSFLTKTQFINICVMQNALNAKVDADWKAQKRDWSTAVVVESAEAINHLGWEWWKLPTPNLAQAKLEIIDILHFTISGLIETVSDDPLELDSLYEQLDAALSGMEPAQVLELRTWSTIEVLKEIAMNSVVDNYGFAVYLSVHAAETLGMSPNEVYDMYVGKNVLNQFRKANGYKEGTYIKMWFGKEDNEYLTEVMNSYTNEGITPTPEQLTERLYETYNTVKVSQH